MSEELLRRIEQNSNEVAARRREVVNVGPFRALLDRSTEMVWVNYAVPVAPIDDAAGAAAALEELRREFHARGRKLRFEFTESLWPELLGLLEAGGLRQDGRHPLMVCGRVDLQPFQAPGAGIRPVVTEDADAVLRTVLTIQREGFGGSAEPPSAEEVAAFREELATGQMRWALGCLDGRPAGIGCTMPLDGVAELAGVATLPAMRRRGMAATVSSFLTREQFEHGGELVWLSAGDAIAQAAYAKVGFRLVGTRLSYIEGNEAETRPE